MDRLGISIATVCLGLFVAACSGDSASEADSSAGNSSATSAGNTSASTSAGATTASTTGSGTVGTTGAGSEGASAVNTTAGTSAGSSTTGVGTTGATTAGTTGAGGGTAAGTSVTTGDVTSTTGGVVVPEPTLVTSGPGAYWMEGELAAGSGSATVTVNEESTFQEWIGFGGTFNEAGWDALSVLDGAERDRAIRLLFSDTEGAGFDWGRLPIGASDYAMDRYTLNDTPDDYEMTNFSIERDEQMLIPYIQAALAIKPGVRLWASPWTPPAWMKDSNRLDGTDANESFESHMLSDPTILDAYALYFARFIEEYQKLGLTIEHVQPQNEPGYATRYPSCLWANGLVATFVGDYLAPTLAERGLDTEIWFGTLSNEDLDPQQLNGLTGAAAEAVVGIGLQWNTISHVGSLANQGYLVMQTEHKCGNYPWETATFNPDQPPNDHAYAEESWGLIKQWLEAGVHAYSAWNMVLDTKGHNLDETRPWPQNALLTVDRSTQTLNLTPAYHVFRHLSQFVDPGAIRLGTQGGDGLAFKNPDGSIVAVLHNSGDQPSDTTLAIGGTTVQFSIPGHGFATANWQG